MSMSRSAAVVVALLGVTGLRVASAAIEGGDTPSETPDVTTTTDPSATTTTTTIVSTTTTLPTTTTTTAADPTQSVEECGSGTFDNHGEYVRSVAHTPG